jgi:drug/metabolite transporter superfamily protein YnfA
VTVTIIYLAVAAALEVAGDFFMRMGLGGRRWGLVAGALVLAGYGLLVNQPALGFGRTLGLYIVVFFLVSQMVAFLAAGERPSASLWLGGALIVAGGLVIHLGRP